MVRLRAFVIASPGRTFAAGLDVEETKRPAELGAAACAAREDFAT